MQLNTFQVESNVTKNSSAHHSIGKFKEDHLFLGVQCFLTLKNCIVDLHRPKLLQLKRFHLKIYGDDILEIGRQGFFDSGSLLDL